MQRKGLSLAGHLNELRARLIRFFIVFFLASGVTVFFVKPILRVLSFPASPSIEKFAFFSPQEIIFVYAKIILSGGLILSLPVFFYQLWKFILPAIEERQRKHFVVPLLSVVLFFTLGFCFGYFFLLPVSLKFLIGLGSGELVAVISIDKYISFALAILLGGGLVFEIPVVVWILTNLRIVDYKFLKKKRKYIIALIFIVAAIITPTTDPFNMCLLAVPMLVLYEIGIWISYLCAKRYKRPTL